MDLQLRLPGVSHHRREGHSLALAANSSGGADIEYGATGWTGSSMPQLVGVSDLSKDSVPDIWAVRSDGSVGFCAGGRTAVVSGLGTQVIGASIHWLSRIAIG
ncbi:hypothetical protein [Streptomyces sp. SD15]